LIAAANLVTEIGQRSLMRLGRIMPGRPASSVAEVPLLPSKSPMPSQSAIRDPTQSTAMSVGAVGRRCIGPKLVSPFVTNACSDPLARRFLEKESPASAGPWFPVVPLPQTETGSRSLTGGFVAAGIAGGTGSPCVFAAFAASCSFHFDNAARNFRDHPSS
jgi:hypothetical protein